MKLVILTRDVTRAECDWLKRDFKRGEVVYLYEGETYGAVGPDGIPCALDRRGPFFELPINAVLSLFKWLLDF